MTRRNEPLFRSALRALLVTAFGVIGLFVGIIPATLLFNAIAGQPGKLVQPKTQYEISPNVDGTRKALRADSPLILKLAISGIIGAEQVNAAIVERVLGESQGVVFDEGRIKGIFVEINTPGGTVVDADNIYRYIRLYKEKHNVPVVAFVNGLCASGGMYVAAAADQVYASDVSLIGSVGVIFPTFLNIHRLLENYGVESLTVSAGKGKDAMNPLRPWQAGESEDFQMITDHYYQQFVGIVTAARPNLDRDKLIHEYGARIFPAPLAAEYGFIDGFGYDYSTALNILVQAAELENKDYQVVELSTRHWWNELLEGNFALFRGKVTHDVQLVPGLSSELANQWLYLYRP